MQGAAIAHPNIALIKYWGKRDTSANLPAVDSLSITLDALTTETRVEFDPSLDRDVLVLNGQEQTSEQMRLSSCMDAIRELVNEQKYSRIISSNNFPTGAGLASSASGYAALVTAAASAVRLDRDDPRLLDIARLGSGSAPRSMHGGFVKLSNDDRGTSCEQLLRPEDWPMVVVIAITSDAPKSISSRSAMEQSRSTSAFYEAWVSSHGDDMRQAVEFVGQRDFLALAAIAESNCLKMHSVMLATRPPIIYWLPETLACMRKVMELRARGLPVFFTVDAGPQVKAVCLPEAANEVAEALRAVSGVEQTMVSGLGQGARQVEI